MKANFLILTPLLFGAIAGDYVGPQNGGNGIGNGNGNGNSYGVPPDSITPPQPQGGPYPPSGWKPAGRRLLLPGESRSGQQPIDSGYGQPPPPQYGPVNPSPSGPSIDSQYGPSIDNSGPPNNQYIPGTGFGNGGSNGNHHTGNGHSNGNSNGNGNGNGHGNGHNGGNNGNGNGHNGNTNGHNGGNGHNGNANGHNGGNGFSNGANGNGFSNGNGHGSNGNGNGNKGSNEANGSNGFAPAFHGAFPGGVIYPFVQQSIPAVLAFRPSNGAGQGSFYPVYQVPISHPQPGTNIITSSFPTGHGVFSLVGGGPTYQISPGTPALGPTYPGFEISGIHNIASSYPAVVGQHTGLIGHGTEHNLLLSNHQSQKLNTLGVNNGVSNLHLQYAVSNSAYGSGGVPLNVF